MRIGACRKDGVQAMLANDLINCDPEIMSGAPVFMGTRVPIKTLFDWLEGGSPLDDFLDNFPSVSAAQAIALLELCKRLLGAGDENIDGRESAQITPAQSA